MAELSRLEETRMNHETSIQHLQDTVSRSSEQHEQKRDQAASTISALTSELRTTKQALDDATKRERQVLYYTPCLINTTILWPFLPGTTPVGSANVRDWQTAGALRRPPASPDCG